MYDANELRVISDRNANSRVISMLKACAKAAEKGKYYLVWGNDLTETEVKELSERGFKTFGRRIYW